MTPLLVQGAGSASTGRVASASCTTLQQQELQLSETPETTSLADAVALHAGNDDTIVQSLGTVMAPDDEAELLQALAEALNAEDQDGDSHMGAYHDASADDGCWE